MAQYIFKNERKNLYIVGQWFSISKEEAGIYDEKTAELIENLLKFRGIKGFKKYKYLGEI